MNIHEKKPEQFVSAVLYKSFHEKKPEQFVLAVVTRVRFVGSLTRRNLHGVGL